MSGSEQHLTLSFYAAAECRAVRQTTKTILIHRIKHSEPEPHANALPFNRPRESIAQIVSFLQPLLLVVHRCALDLVAFCIGSARSDRATFSVGRYYNATTGGDLTVFRDVEPKCTVVDLGDRPRV